MADDSAKGSSIELLDTNNWGTWSFRMKNYLISKGLGGCIDGTGTTAGSERDQKALSHIALHVKDHHIATISACTTAKAAWDALKALHQAKNMARRQQLRRDLTAIRMNDGEPLTVYFNRAKTMWQDLVATGDTLTESELVWIVLNGLPKEYELMVTIFEAGDARDLNMDATLAKLLPVDAKITRVIEDEGKAFYGGGAAGTGRHVNDSRECWHCGKKGHIKRNCPQLQRERQVYRCASAFERIAL
jgi:hypothetical protein